MHVGDLTPAKVSELKLTDANGALVVGLDQDGPACKAGLKENDVIVALDGKKVEDPEQLVELISNMPGGKPATVTVWRGGRSQDIKVVLGSRRQWMALPPVHYGNAFAGPVPPVPPVPPIAMPDVEIQTFTPTAARHGLMVESLSPQLAEFFGVAQGQGVLVRTVQKGSPAAIAGVKAGDVIMKVNGEVVHDIADWRRSMKSHSGKVSLSVMRDRREQTLEMNLPGPTGMEMKPEDWNDFQNDMDAFRLEMEQLRPELEQQMQEVQQAQMLNQDELEQMQRDLEKSMKQMEPQLQKQSKEIQKQMKKMQPQIERQARELQMQMEAMRPEIARQATEMARTMTLKQEDVEKMRHEIEDSMKELQPQLQKQMDELKRQMEQHKFDMQKLMNGWDKDNPEPDQF